MSLQYALTNVVIHAVKRRSSLKSENQLAKEWGTSLNTTKSTLRVLAISLCVGQTALAQPLPQESPNRTSGTEATDSFVVRDQLVALGLTEVEAQARLSALSAEDISVLAQNPKLNGKGGVKDKTLIIIACILIIPSILLLAAF